MELPGGQFYVLFLILCNVIDDDADDLKMWE